MTRVYVSLADEAAALLAALALGRAPDAMGVPVTVAVEDDAAGVSLGPGLRAWAVCPA